MALPKVKQALYDHQLYSTKKKIKYRGFTGAEQKILLLAKEAAQNADTEVKNGASQEVINAVSQIINNCTLGKVDPDELATFDMEELFIRIRSKSVGELMSVRYRENYRDEEDRPKSHFIDININLDDIKIKEMEGHSNIIEVTPEVGIVMRYPTFEMLNKANSTEDLVVSCIDHLYDADGIYDRTTTTDAEFIQFYDDLETPVIMKIQNFFATMPKLYYETEVTLHDGQKETIKFEGLQSFFS